MVEVRGVTGVIVMSVSVVVSVTIAVAVVGAIRADAITYTTSPRGRARPYTSPRTRLGLKGCDNLAFEERDEVGGVVEGGGGAGHDDDEAAAGGVP